MNNPVVVPKRCAVYARVSSDERLDQSFNSIDAQKEAGHAFIASQRSEGWIPVADGYDDGGYSGGNMERPALKRLLADIEAGKIDIVVVYKIDRLSRSLADFARMVDVFDRCKVSFSAVTQQINSATSMGRLMLNVLLSFAQFEREVTGERIRDKIAASKAKGMWMGGTPPIGYDVVDRRLVVNEPEAKTVREIFTRFVALRSIVEVVRELNLQGVTTKAWVSGSGINRTGQPITKQFLYKLLRNPVYVGQIRHKGTCFEGQHETIIDRASWDATHAILAEDATERKIQTMARRRHDSLRRGLLFGPNGERMLSTFAYGKSGGKRYHYYYPSTDKKYGHGTSRLGAIPREQIDELVLRQVLNVLRRPEIIQAVWDQVQESDPGIDEAQTVVALSRLADVWSQLFPEEKHRLVHMLIERVQITDEGLEIKWHDLGWRDLVGEMRPNTIGAELLAKEREAA